MRQFALFQPCVICRDWGFYEGGSSSSAMPLLVALQRQVPCHRVVDFGGSYPPPQLVNQMDIMERASLSVQLADRRLLSLQQPIAESRIVAEEYRWNIVPGGLGAADWLFLGCGIVQAVADVSCPGHGFAGIGFELVF